MKYIKYALLLLFVAIITDTALVFAAKSVDKNPALSGNSSDYYTARYVKDTWSDQQWYLKTAKTSLTNPCNSCQVAAKPYGDTVGGQVGIIAKPTQKIAFPNAQNPDIWKLNIWRVDFSLLTTEITSTWYIDL